MTVLAADRFHVPPWELVAQGKAWVEMAVVTVNAERRAEAEIQKRQARQARMARMKGSR